MKPMLAFKFPKHKVNFPCFVQPKLNGIRAMRLPRQVDASFFLQSRDEIIWHKDVLTHLGNDYPIPLIFDGELYKHGMSLQQINSRVAVKRVSPHKDETDVEYHVFDIASQAPMWKRVKALERIFLSNHESSIKMVPTHLVRSPNEADAMFRQFVAMGYEGMMYRAFDAPYGFAEQCGNQENRWKYILKRKDWLDMDAKIIGLEEEISIEGERKNALGSFLFQTEDGIPFSAGSGLTRDQRNRYWQMGDACLGWTCRIKYEMLSDSNTPLKPVIECVYEQ